LRSYGYVSRNDEKDRVQKCPDYEVAVVRPRDMPKKTWSEVIEEKTIGSGNGTWRMLWIV